jgi:hypothetical protein
MVNGQALRVGALAWAVVGLVVAIASIGRVNPDARVAVSIGSVAFPGAAALASLALTRRRDRTAGLLLLVSVATPTYFAWVLNVPALCFGSALLLSPNLIVRRQGNLET